MAELRTAAMATRRAEMMEVISATALEQFSLYGFHGTSTQTIAERAGISKQQLHYYIESKDALYESILLRTMERWNQIALHAEDAKLDPATVIARLVRSKLEFALDYPQMSRLFTNEIISGGHAMQGVWSRNASTVNTAVAVVAEWVRERKIAPVEPIFFLFHIWAMTQHYADYERQVRFFTACPPGEPLDREKICAEITRFVLRGVGLSAGPTPIARRRGAGNPPLTNGRVPASVPGQAGK